jgi:hypothetical protein
VRANIMFLGEMSISQAGHWRLVDACEKRDSVLAGELIWHILEELSGRFTSHMRSSA